MKKLYQKFKPHYRTNLTLAIPVVISQLGHTLVQLADSVIVGHYAGLTESAKTVSLAAVSLVNSIFVVAMLFGIGISYGITPLIAQYNGQKNYAECGRLLSNSLFINTLNGVLLFVLIYFGLSLTLGHLDQSPEVVALAKPFMLLLSLSIIPMLLFNTFKQFTEGLGFTKQAMMISIWGNVLNVCLGIIFVKGLLGVPPMGIRGVGYSTLIDRILMATVMGFYVFRSKNFKQYLRDFVPTAVDVKRCIQLLRIGTPVAMQYIFEVGAFSAAAVLIGTFGAVPQAAHQVAINLASLTYMMASGISAAAAIKSGNYFGAKNYEDLRHSALVSYHIVILFMLFTAFVFITGNHLLPHIVTSDPRVIAVASQLLIIAALFQLFDGTQVIGLGILRGVGDVNIPTLITFLAYWVVGLPIGYLLGFHFELGARGVWYGLVAGLASASILLYFRFRSITKRHATA